MRKESYLDALMDKLDEKLMDIAKYDSYSLSVANASSQVDKAPVLVVDYPDDSSRAYVIRYNAALINAADSIEDVNVSSIIEDVINDIVDYEENIIPAHEDEDDYDDYDDYDDEEDYEDENEGYEDDIEEDTGSYYHNKEYYKDYDTDYLDEFTDTAKEWLHDYKLNNPDKIIDESKIDYEKLNDIYQNNDKSFHKTMKTEISKLTRSHTEDYYEGYDTDYADEFEETARQYIKDNRNSFNTDAEEIAECIDYEELNEQYQNNGLSFRETMADCLKDLGVYEEAETEQIHSPITFKPGFFSELTDTDEAYVRRFINRSPLITEMFNRLPVIPEEPKRDEDFNIKMDIIRNTQITIKSTGLIEITAKDGGNATGALLYIDEILKQIQTAKNYESPVFQIGVPTTDKILAINSEDSSHCSIEDTILDIRDTSTSPNVMSWVTSNVYIANLATNHVVVVENDRESVNRDNEDNIGWNIEF